MDTNKMLLDIISALQGAGCLVESIRKGSEEYGHGSEDTIDIRVRPDFEKATKQETEAE